jgi:hypothetical protein
MGPFYLSVLGKTKQIIAVVPLNPKHMQSTITSSQVIHTNT